MEVGIAIKALAWIIGVICALLGLSHYGGLREEKGRQKGISEAREVNDENYTDLANDVLDGPHPYRVRNEGVAEISGSGSDSGVRVASDVQPGGESDRLARDRNGST